MKIAIVFYSFSGNTKRACLFLKDKLIGKNTVDLLDLKPKKEEKNFFKQCLQALFRAKPDLKEVNYDLSKYDFVIFASAVWAFAFVPALHSYLEKVKGLENKKVACFLTYGSGLGSNKALKELEGILREKEILLLFSENLEGVKTEDNRYLEDEFRPLLEILDF